MKLKLSVIQKLLIGYLSLGIIFLTAIVTTLIFIEKTSFYTHRVESLRIPTALTSLRNNSLLNKYLREIEKWIFIKEEVSEELSKEYSLKIDNNFIMMNNFAEKWTNPKNILRLGKASENWNRIKTISEEIKRSKNKNELFKKSLIPLAKEITEILEEMSGDQSILLKSDSSKNKKLIGELKIIQFWLLGVGIFFWAISCIYISHSIKKGISDTIDNMVQNIKKVTSNLSRSSGEFFLASEQLSKTSSNLSGTVSAQAASLEETSSSLDEIHAQAEMNTELSEKSSEYTENVTSSSQICVETMNDLVKSMKEILVANEEMYLLVEVIREIGEKTEIINDIVFKTQMLSFNASVEAERAGESGRGFAVVAQEVGSLAELSGTAAIEISSKVKSSITTVRKITEKNKEKVDSGSLLVKEVAELLQRITSEARKSFRGSQSILSASSEQTMGISQIRTTMYDLEKITHKNAILSDEASVASNRLLNQSKSLQEEIKYLNSYITNGNFKLMEERKQPLDLDTLPSDKDSSDPENYDFKKEDKEIVNEIKPIKKASGGWDDI